MGTLGQDTLVEKVMSGIHETMYYMVRKKFFNGLYDLQAILSSCFILRLVFDKKLEVWHPDIVEVVEWIFTVLNAPLYKLDLPEAYIGFGFAVCLFTLIIVLGGYVSYGLAHSSLNHPWMVTFFRALLGFGQTFYFLPFQTWLAWVRCDYFGQFGNSGLHSNNLEIHDTATGQPMVCFSSSQVNPDPKL